MLYLILFIILVVMIVLKFVRAEKIPHNTIMLFTGSLGCGKTYLAVERARAAYRKQFNRHKWQKRLPFLKYIFKGSEHPATLFSNIPVKLPYGGISTPFTKEHLMMRENLPEKCVVLLDEFGQMCSQWEFDNPYVMENVQSFVRFFRHFTDGRMYLTDQMSSSLVKPVRDRVGIIYYLHDFHRWLGLPFYYVTTVPLLSVEDTNTEIDDSLERYFFGFLPYPWQRKKKYQSRVYKRLYTKNAVREITAFDESLYTEYLIDVSVSDLIRKDYKKDREKWKDYLYNRFPELPPEPMQAEGVAGGELSL